MSGELVKFETPKMPSLQASTVEQVLLKGDLAQLRPEERCAYYDNVCKSLGLNPLTRPFEYLQLNGKLILYAKRECTEQLRQLHNVSVTIVSRESVEGCYVVTARATLPNGRQDESIGAVGIDGLKGEARSNALMKSETKAKRRVTLSICGLAYLDESEAEGQREMYHVPVDMQTGAIPDPAPAATLTEDIKVQPVKETKASKAKGTTPFEWLEHFSALKKRFEKIGKIDVYYTILPKYGVEKSNQFPATPDGKTAAKGCYKELSLTIQDLEVAALGPEVTVKPDPVPLSIGARVRFEGKLWEVWDSPEGFDWREVAK